MRMSILIIVLAAGVPGIARAAESLPPAERVPPGEPQWSAARARLSATEAARGVDPDAWLDSLRDRSVATDRSIEDLLVGASVPSPVPARAVDPDAWQPRGVVPVLRVGDDPFCDYTASPTSNGLQQAIDAALADGAGETEIRVANSGSYVNRRYFINDIGDQSLTIIGGFPSCDNLTASETTTLDRGTASSGPVVLIDSVSTPELVSLENLVLRGGDGTTGGALEVRNNNFVILTDVRLTASNATLGGGMAVVDLVDGTTTTAWMLGESSIGGNTASSRGGGIYCFGTDAGIALDSAVAVNGNSAVTGGGMALRGGCRVDAYSSLPAGIFSNAASDDGGGVWADGGSEFRMLGGGGGFGFGDASVEATLDTNQAADEGGGAYAEGAGTLIRATDAWIWANQASFGGGVSLRDGAELQMDRTLAGDACADELRCSWLASNTASGAGGGVRARGDAPSVDIRQTWVENNRSEASGMALLISGNDGARADLFVEGSIFSGNEPIGASGAFRSLIDLQVQTDAVVAYSTMFDNLAGDFVDVFSAANNVNLQLYSSIFSEPTGGLARVTWGSSNTGVADCLLVWDANAESDLPPGSTFIGVDDDPALLPSGLLSAGSRAVDYCDDSVYAAFEPDILGAPRGVDTAGQPDLLGPFDLGAHEFTGTVDGGSVSITPQLVETAENAGEVLFSVLRSGGSEGEARIRVFTVAESASAGEDYVALAQEVVWSNGENLPRLVSVSLIDDAAAEPAETFTVRVQRISGTASVETPGAATVRVFDNEQGIFADGFEGADSI